MHWALPTFAHGFPQVFAFFPQHEVSSLYFAKFTFSEMMCFAFYAPLRIQGISKCLVGWLTFAWAIFGSTKIQARTITARSMFFCHAPHHICIMQIQWLEFIHNLFPFGSQGSLDQTKTTILLPCCFCPFLYPNLKKSPSIFGLLTIIGVFFVSF